MMDKAKKELKAIMDLPVLYTALAVLIAHSTQNELTQLAAFFVLLIIIIIRKHDSRIPIGFALVLLALAAFQLAFTTEAAANSTAILAYYLLCAGVAAQFVEYLKNPKEDVSPKTITQANHPDCTKITLTFSMNFSALLFASKRISLSNSLETP